MPLTEDINTNANSTITTTTTTTAAAAAAAAATVTSQDASGREPSSTSSGTAQLASEQIILRSALRQFPNFPIPGIDFVDILPLFADPTIHNTLLSALKLQIAHAFGNVKPDVIVGLDARGFLFGPSLALHLGVSFAPVRKKGKLPGPCVTAEYVKEYGADFFQMQQDAVKPGQKVIIVDDIIATGGSAKAAADLVTQLQGEVVGFQFILAVPGLDGHKKLGDIPTAILIDF